MKSISRRSFLASMAALVSAPVIVRADSLMRVVPVKSVQSPVYLPRGVWQHITLLRDGVGSKVFVDGVFVGSNDPVVSEDGKRVSDFLLSKNEEGFTVEGWFQAPERMKLEKCTDTLLSMSFGALGGGMTPLSVVAPGFGDLDVPTKAGSLSVYNSPVGPSIVPLETRRK